MSGLTIAELAAELGVEERRCRKIAASLADRDLVVVAADDGAPQRVWLPDQRLAFRRESGKLAGYLAFLKNRESSTGVTCPNCAWWIQTSVRSF
jgi:hypothetical protein